MKISLTKFILLFLFSASAFIIITNLLLHPINGEWFAGTNSPVAWKRTLAAIIYPVKVVLVGPLAPVLNDPDPVPPIRALACAVYWTVIAWVFYLILNKIMPRRKHDQK